MDPASCCEVVDGIHLMAGLPDWMFFSGIGLILTLSFGFYFLKSKPAATFRYDLTRFTFIKWLVTRRWFQFALQLPVLIIFLIILYAGFFGNSRINIAPALTWTIWWGGLIFAILLFGKIWCTLCPWDMVASVLSRLKFWNVGIVNSSLNLKWPKKARNITLAIGLFIALTWLELGYKVTASPFATAVLGLAMLLMVVLPVFLFEKKSFCRYGCLIGRISGIYANISPFEVRAKDRNVCLSCTSKDCYNGNENGYACPTGLNLTGLNQNTYCTLCTECFKSCPSDNVALNVRPLGADIIDYPKPRMDEAILAVILLSLTAFHGLTMTPMWEDLAGGGDSIIARMNEFFGLGPLFSFSIGMTAILLIPYLLYHAMCWLSSRLSGGAVSTREVFIRFAYSLVPIALFYHLAHNGMHVAMEAQNVVPLLSDPFGYGWNLFGTMGVSYPMLMGDQSVWLLQVATVVFGHVLGIRIAARAGEKMFGHGKKALIAQIPLLLAMVIFSFVSMWIMHLDMNMRSSMM